MQPSVVLGSKVPRQRVVFLSFGFWLLFCAYSAAQLLQTSVNGASGYACLAVLYGLFALAALTAPALVVRLNARLLIPIAAVPYALMVAANMINNDVLLLMSCAGVGLGAAFLWSAQGVFIGGCGKYYAATAGIPLTQANSAVNSLFYAIFSSSGGVSALLSWLLLSYMKNAIQGLFFVLTIVGIAAVVAFCALPDENAFTDTVVAPLCCLASLRSARDAVSTLLTGRAASRAPLSQLSDQDATAAGRSLPRNAAFISGASGSMPAAVDNPVAVDAASPLDADMHTVDFVAPVAASSGSAAERHAAMHRVSRGGSVATDAHDIGLAANSSVDAATSALPGPAPASAAATGASASRPSPPSVAYMLNFIFTNRYMLFILPLLFCVGMGQGIFSSLWMGAVVAADVGVKNVGLVGAAYSFACAAASMGFGKFAQLPQYGRRWTFVIVTVLQLVFYTFFMLWTWSDAASRSPRALSVAVHTFGSIVFGIGDGAWMSQIPAMLQTLFPEGKEAPCAMAAIRFCNALGFTFTTVVGIMFRGHRASQFLFCGLCLVFSTLSLAYFHRRVASIDGKPLAAQAAAAADAPVGKAASV